MAASKAQYASTSLYVGDLSPEANEATLYDFFNSVGPVASIKVCRDTNSRLSLGYAYVNYHSIQDAERALETLNYTEIKGTSCRIMWSQRDPMTRRANLGNLFVKNLDKTVDNRALHDTFSLFGNILSCKVVTDEQGRSRGFGFVHFESDECAAEAVERVNGMKIGDKEVYVAQHKKRTERPSGKTENFTNLYTKDFPASWEDAMLNTIFGEHGTITSLWRSADSKGRPFACVNFAQAAEAKKALAELNGKYVDENGLCADQDAAATLFAKQQAAGVRKAPSAAADAAAAAKDDKTKATNTEQEDEREKPVESKATDDDSKTAPAADKKPADEAAPAASEEASTKPAAEEQQASNEPQPSTSAAQPPHIYRLFVDRAQDKAERTQSLRSRYLRPQQQQHQQAQQNVKKYDGVNLYIKNLAEEVDDMMLRSMFEPFGTITSAKIMRNDRGVSKGFGFVCFTSEEEATRAIAEMHLKLHYGKPLYVGLAEQKDRRQARLQSHFRQRQVPAMAAPHPQPSAGMAPSQSAFPGSAASPFFHAAAPAGGAQAAASWHHHPHGPAPPQAGGVHWKPPYLGGAPAAGAPPPMMQGMPAGGPTPAGYPPARGMAGPRPRAAPAAQAPGAPDAGAMGMGDYNVMAAAAQLQQQMAAQHHHHAVAAAAQQQPDGRGAAPVMQAQPQPAAAYQSNYSKQVLGEQLFPLVYQHHPTLAGKITGMMLDMDDSELVVLINSETELKAKIDEAVRVLHKAGLP